MAELVAIPSVADPRQFPPQECARAAQWVLDRFAQVGFTDLRLTVIRRGEDAMAKKGKKDKKSKAKKKK